MGDVHFRKQHAIGNYIVDFCAPRKKLIIELDGSQHLEQQEYDAERTEFLKSKGYTVLRFWNNAVLNNMDSVLNVIWDALSESPSALAGTSPKSDRSTVDFGGGRVGVEPAWPEVDVIVGNPPFLGSQRMRSELGDKYVDDLRSLYEGRIPGASDLVCYWFEKARAMIETGKAKRAGLLATNSIRGGANRKVLERIKETGDIFWAQSNRDWILDGAAVNVSMIGFDDKNETQKLLDDKFVETINSDLSFTGSDSTQAKKLLENSNLCFQGPVKVGPFDIPNELAQQMLLLPNPNGKSNRDVIKPWMNGSDITSRSRNMWIIDFGEMEIEESAQYEAPFEYVKKNIKPLRDSNADAQRRTYWWRLGRSGNDLKEAIRSLDRFIITPRVSKFRLFAWANKELLPDSAVVAIALNDDYSFGVLHSKIHEIWSLKLGTSLEDRPRYTPSTTFETFPFPWAPNQEPKDDPRVQAIGQAAKELVEQRDRWLNATPSALAGTSPKSAEEKTVKPTGGADLGEDGRGSKRTLTNLYNARPTWLELAHKRLDQAVFAAYGWKSDLTDEEILEKLLALNLERGK